MTCFNYTRNCTEEVILTNFLCVTLTNKPTSKRAELHYYDGHFLSCLLSISDSVLSQISEVVNTSEEQTVKIESSDCEVITRERRFDKHMIWNSTVVSVSRPLSLMIKVFAK